MNEDKAKARKTMTQEFYSPHNLGIMYEDKSSNNLGFISVFPNVLLINLDSYKFPTMSSNDPCPPTNRAIASRTRAYLKADAGR